MEKNHGQLKRLITKAAKKSAENSANSACYFWAYQPKEPKAVKSMRKF